MSIQNPFHFKLGIMPEINQQAQLKIRRLQIIDDLRLIFITQRLGGFYLHYDFIVANEIRFVSLL